MRLPERRTVGALLAYQPQAMPQQEVVVFPPQRLTYAALYEQATAAQIGLVNRVIPTELSTSAVAPPRCGRTGRSKGSQTDLTEA